MPKTTLRERLKVATFHFQARYENGRLVFTGVFINDIPLEDFIESEIAQAREEQREEDARIVEDELCDSDEENIDDEENDGLKDDIKRQNALVREIASRIRSKNDTK